MATLAEVLTALDARRDALAANLETMGVESASSETLADLVPKVLLIETGGGGAPVPSGDGTEDTYTGSRTTSGGSYAGLCADVEVKGSWWLAAVKLATVAATTVATVNVRKFGGQVLASVSGVALAGGGAFTTVPLASPVLLDDGDFVRVEVLFGNSQQLTRRTSYLYDGTLWKMVANHVNSWTGASYSETPGLGLIEYGGV